MDAAVYAVDAALEATHWWYVGRRRLFTKTIAALGVPPDAPVLDVGTSAGTNLRMLRDAGFTRVTGLDTSPEAVRFCAEKKLPEVALGDLLAMPFPDDHFALVLATDVIEHVDDDARALAEIVRVLRPGGHALVTVPAFPSLWGLQDEVSHHKRRYRMPELLERVRASGLEPVRSFHFNYLLFGPIWLARQLMRWKRPDVRSESELNTPLVNKLLSAVFALDIDTAPRVRVPFGVSALVLARKA